MLKIIFVVLFFQMLNGYSINSNNSIYNVSKNARINSLGGMHILSNNVSGIFKQPINLNSQMKGDSYYSYISYFDNSVNIIQFAVCIKSNKKQNISIGILKRSISDNFNTANAWNYDNDGPGYNDINYSQIGTFSDHEIGFIAAISHKISPTFSLNVKLKPNYHKIYSNFAYGFGTDIIILKRFKNVDLIFGVEDIISFKKWDNGTEEVYRISSYFNCSFHSDKFLLFVESNNEKYVMYGFEYNLNKFFLLRCGYDKNKYPTMGIGVETNVANFDYSYIRIENNIFDYVKQYSLIIKFDGIKKVYKGLKI